MIRSHTTYTIEHEGNVFPVDIKPIDSDNVSVTIKGNKARVGWLASDDDGGSGYYFDEHDSGQYLNFDSRTLNSRAMIDPDELAELIEANPKRVFWVNKYEHGLVRYYRSGDALEAPKAPSTEPAQDGLHIPDQRWDVSKGCAIYVAPEDATEPAKYADGVLQEFSDWCNGSIYGVCVQNFKRKSKKAPWVADGDVDSCWGHIGYTWAVQAMAEEMKD